MSANERSKKATPPDILRGLLFDPCEPKTEMEHFAAREVERLERELSDEKRLHNQAQDELARVLLDLNDTEAQAAATREALKDAIPSLRMALDVRNINEGHRMRCLAATIIQLEYALSADAGRKVLDVVEAAEAFFKSDSDVKHSPALERLRQALAAMGKP